MAARRPTRYTTPATTFSELGVPKALTDILDASGITVPFPIQAATLPDSLAGRDVLGRGRTGSGKTLGFLLPVLTRLGAEPRKRRPNRPRALILAPTRELAVQIHDAAKPFAAALGLRTAVIFGGVSAGPQISALRSGADLVIACPGRLLDHLASGHAILDAVEVTVLDEADHMADLGFLPVVKRILDATPTSAQRLLFSATLDNGIDQLARRYLTNPVTHAVDSPHSEVPDMAHHVLHIEADHRLPILIELAGAPGRTIVFTRTKHGARKLAKQLTAAQVPAVELHGNLAQNARTRNLAAFSQGLATTLVATDIAARGIHVDDVELIVHADPPVEHKAYLHRSGRTARAGNSGTVITLMTDAQVDQVRELTRKAKIKATTTRLAPGDPLITTLAPGERGLTAPMQLAALESAPAASPRKPSKPGQPGKSRKPGQQGTTDVGGRPRRQHGGRGGGALGKRDDGTVAKIGAGSPKRHRSAHSDGGKTPRSPGSLPSGPAGAIKVSQGFRGRAR